MFTTLLFREVLDQVATDLRTRFAGYRLSAFEEELDEPFSRELLEKGVWHGYYENIGVAWKFELSKMSHDWKGPQKQRVSVHPHFDVMFADIYPNVFHVEVGFQGHPDREARPAIAQVDGVPGTIWDLHVFYDTAERDL